MKSMNKVISKFISTGKMSMQLRASSKSPSCKKRTEEGLSNQTFMTDLFPKQLKDDHHSTKEFHKNIVVDSRVSRKLGVWHPGFNPILHPDYCILRTVLVADSKHHWIIKWDKDNYNSKVLVGIIPNRDDVGLLSENSIKLGHCT